MLSTKAVLKNSNRKHLFAYQNSIICLKFSPFLEIKLEVGTLVTILLRKLCHTSHYYEIPEMYLKGRKFSGNMAAFFAKTSCFSREMERVKVSCFLPIFPSQDKIIVNC